MKKTKTNNKGTYPNRSGNNKNNNDDDDDVFIQLIKKLMFLLQFFFTAFKPTNPNMIYIETIIRYQCDMMMI